MPESPQEGRALDSTSVSLLRRLHSDDREIAWERFVELYAPLIYHWTLKTGLSGHDAADCVQDVLATLVEKLRTFKYDPSKSFRAWLRTVTRNKCRDAMRKRATIAQGAVPLNPEDAASPNDTELFTDRDYQLYVVQRAMEVMQAEFETSTWQACWSQVIEGKSAAEVAQQLNLSENAVYLAKSRVLRRLRDELEDLLD